MGKETRSSWNCNGVGARHLGSFEVGTHGSLIGHMQTKVTPRSVGAGIFGEEMEFSGTNCKPDQIEVLQAGWYGDLG
jgi:hypothetical protein